MVRKEGSNMPFTRISLFTWILRSWKWRSQRLKYSVSFDAAVICNKGESRFGILIGTDSEASRFHQNFWRVIRTSTSSKPKLEIFLSPFKFARILNTQIQYMVVEDRVHSEYTSSRSYRPLLDFLPLLSVPSSNPLFWLVLVFTLSSPYRHAVLYCRKP